MKSQLETSTTSGTNHTGLAPHGDVLARMLEGASEFPPTSSGGPAAIAEVRVDYARTGEPPATMPSTAVAPARLPLLDRLGARMQFERTGTRLYDALISKFDAYGSFDGGPSRQELLVIREQELAHALLVQDLISSLGGDPTAITPGANLTSTVSQGIACVLLDPRTSLIDCLEAMLIIELTDQDSWGMLARTAEPVGDAAMIDQIRQAQQTELEHLAKLRGWLEAADQARSKVVRSTR
ncbi:MAG TPA: ferritin-like domain-containing protein [Kofleriaceae bacterium]|jgi:hypothetical protein|nr:ferritin-like domain-containing protein [Kofleriaceae bacterium]